MAVDHVKLMGAIHQTLREVSTAPLADSPHTQSQNQAIFDSKLRYWGTVQWDANLTDDEVWKRICLIPFFAGVKPMEDTRQARTMEFIGDYREVGAAKWLESERGVEYIQESKQHDPAVHANAAYWNPKDTKGPTIVRAANRLVARQALLGFSLIDLLVPKRYRHFSEDALKSIFANFKSELSFGFITRFHAMMDMGLPVVKPDTMLVRTVVRLGLITAYGNPASKSGRTPVSLKATSEDAKKLGQKADFVWELQTLMRDIAASTCKTTREVDWLFAKMGMTKTLEEGREFVVCDDQPKCNQCHANQMCAYAAAYYKAPKANTAKAAKQLNPSMAAA